ncbi:MAG: hypothetical protein H8F28_24905 [Fibrella sp.]|nr:hypothetical protein [Armatimonadota bacterium]
MFSISIVRAEDWDEGRFLTGDAGGLPADAQNTFGRVGVPLDTITGALVNPSGFDMFRIFLNGTTPFSATTISTPSGAGFLADSVLSLYTEDGVGIYANNDTSSAEVRSTLPDRSLPAGIYNLLITSSGRNPVSADGRIFNLGAATDILTPTGPGGALPISGYNNVGTSSGQYTVTLTGAQFAVAIPETGTLPLLAAGSLLTGGVLCRKRRRSK